MSCRNGAGELAPVNVRDAGDRLAAGTTGAAASAAATADRADGIGAECAAIAVGARRFPDFGQAAAARTAVAGATRAARLIVTRQRERRGGRAAIAAGPRRVLVPVKMPAISRVGSAPTGKEPR